MMSIRLYNDRPWLLWQQNLRQNSARIENIAMPLAPSSGIRGWALEWWQTNSTTTNPVTLATKFKTKISYKSACIRDRPISKMLADNRGVLRDRLSNDVSQILRGPSLVAMATKFKTKSPITRLVLDISLRCLPLTRGSQWQTISKILRGAILVVMATKFETKSAITRFVYYEMQ